MNLRVVGSIGLSLFFFTSASAIAGPVEAGDAHASAGRHELAGKAYLRAFEETTNPVYLKQAGQAFVALGQAGRSRAIEAGQKYANYARSAEEARDARALLAQAKALPVSDPPRPPAPQVAPTIAPAPAPLSAVPPTQVLPAQQGPVSLKVEEIEQRRDSRGGTAGFGLLLTVGGSSRLAGSFLEQGGLSADNVSGQSGGAESSASSADGAKVATSGAGGTASSADPSALLGGGQGLGLEASFRYWTNDRFAINPAFRLGITSVTDADATPIEIGPATRLIFAVLRNEHARLELETGIELGYKSVNDDNNEISVALPIGMAVEYFPVDNLSLVIGARSDLIRFSSLKQQSLGKDRVSVINVDIDSARAFFGLLFYTG